MFALRILVIAVVIAAVIHLDWHLARPGHMGMNWPFHSAVTAVLFAVIGWGIARRWPGERWLVAALALMAGVLIGQGIEPLSEALIYDHRFGYEGSPERWMAFWQALGAGVVLYIGGLWLARSSRK